MAYNEMNMPNNVPTIESYLKRVSLFLEDGNWGNADKYCEKILDMDPENADAYLGKLLAKVKAKKKEDLLDCPVSFENSTNYKKVIHFGSKELNTELTDYITHINIRNEKTRVDGMYNRAKNAMAEATTEFAFAEAARLFGQIPEYKDSTTLAMQCCNQAQTARMSAKKRTKKKIMIAVISVAIIFAVIATIVVLDVVIIPGSKYSKAIALMEDEKFDEAIAIFEALDDYKDSQEKSTECKYRSAVALMRHKKYDEAIAIFQALYGYKDSADRITQCNYEKAVDLEMAENYPAALMAYIALGDYADAQSRKEGLWDRFAVRDTIAAGRWHTAALRTDGKVVAVGTEPNAPYGCYVNTWKNIIAISAGTQHTVGLRADGTVVSTELPDHIDLNVGQCEVSGWSDIVAISAGWGHTVGLKSDGTVVATEYIESRYFKYDGQCEVSDWTDIIAVAAGDGHTVGLKADGTVVAVGSNFSGQCEVGSWTDIVAVSAGSSHTVGLKADGTVVAVGNNDYGECNVSGWRDIIAVSAGDDHVVGLKADGTVISTKYTGDQKYYNGQCEVTGWEDIVSIAADTWHTVGLKADGTMVAVGTDYDGQLSDWCKVSQLTKIKLPTAKGK